MQRKNLIIKPVNTLGTITIFARKETMIHAAIDTNV